jgi:hypothetical protein
MLADTSSGARVAHEGTILTERRLVLDASINADSDHPG